MIVKMKRLIIGISCKAIPWVELSSDFLLPTFRIEPCFSKTSHNVRIVRTSNS